MRRFFAFVALVLTATILTPVAHADQASDAAQFTALLNGERAAHGLGPLPRDSRLDAVASSWSSQMAASGTLSHNPALRSDLPPGWVRGGENVGEGSSVTQIHAAFVASAEHEANILGDWTSVGVGVAYSGNGTIWVTEDFVQLPPPVAPAQPSRKVPTVPTTPPTPPPAGSVTPVSPPATPVEHAPSFTG